MNVKLASIVLPAHNESKNVQPIAQAILTVFDDLPAWNCEVVFVDDGSSDDTVAKVEELHKQEPRIKLIQLFRNFGHQNALTAGIEYATGDVVVTMDADMQHPPELIPKLIEQYEKGNDIVFTTTESKDRGVIIETISKTFYYVFQKLTRLPVLNGADFRLMSRPVIDALNQMPERIRFLRGLSAWIGGRSTVVSYKINERLHGQSSYSFKMSANLAMSGFIGFTGLPLKMMFAAGLAVCSISFIYGIYNVLHKIFIGTAQPGYTDIIAAVLFLGGLQLCGMSIMCKYIMTTLDEVRARPIFIVRKVIGFNTRQRQRQQTNDLLQKHIDVTKISAPIQQSVHEMMRS